VSLATASITATQTPSRHGTQTLAAFRWEADMTALVAGQIARLMPRSEISHFVVPEVPAAVGIADLVAVRFDHSALTHRLANDMGPLCSPLRIRVLDLLRCDRPMRIGTLARKVGSTPHALSRSTLRPLHELGVVELAHDAAWATGKWRSVAAHVTSVELKLCKWRDALKQADNFALGADRSWVVLDQARARPALAAVGFFRQFGVGLAVLSTDGRLRVIAPPATRRCHRWLRALIAERAWAVAETEVAAIAAQGLQQRSPTVEEVAVDACCNSI
jgi:predicted transcriptional regulator